MPRSRINGNFIDKTFSIVANILLRIIPTTSGEKEAFTYYRDGVIWLSFFFIYILRWEDIFFREKEKSWKNLRLLKVKFVNKTIKPFCRVSPINAASICFKFRVIVLSKRLYLYLIELVRSTLLQIGGLREEALRLGINNTKENFVKIKKIFPFGIGTNKNGWDNKHPSRSYFGYPYNHRRLLKWLIPRN